MIAASITMTGHENELKASAEMKKYAVNIDSSSNKQNDKDQVKEEQRVKKRKYLESGCGGGKKKHKIVDSFYNTLWPILEEAGWSLVSANRNTRASEDEIVLCACVVCDIFCMRAAISWVGDAVLG